MSTPLMTKIEPKTKDENKVGMDFSYFEKNKVVLPTHDDISAPEEKKKTTRKRKSSSSINTSGSKGNTENDMDEPYSKKYEETTSMLRTAIAQLDMSLNDMQTDIQQIRTSRTLKRKYDYLSMMQGNMGQFINTKVSALREINNTITKCNDFELKRMKELKLAESSKDDDKAIMDMYNAFISTPVSSGMQLGPALSNITTGSNMINTSTIGNTDAGYQDYINNLDPTQTLMMYENDPDVQQVVMYDESTGARWFEIINVRTGQTIPNADKHGAIILEDTTLDLTNNIARNVNIGESYPIVRVGKSVMDIY